MSALKAGQAGRIDELFAPWTVSGQPGATLAVLRAGEVVLQRCYGLANIEHGVAIRPETRFHIASITKTFVGASCVLLHREGKLSIDDPVTKHIPELKLSAPLSVRQLLNMISGLRDSMESMSLRGVLVRYPRSGQDLLDLVFNQRTLSYPTAERYVYTNINFNLLSLIIERISGRSFVDFVTERIWQPLGMSSTLLRDSNAMIVPGLADAYIPRDGKMEKGVWAFGLSGAGGFVSNLPDLLRWQAAFRAGAIGNVKMLDLMSERGRLKDGRLVNYGLGLGVRRHRGVTVLCHGGALPGYRAMFARVPERDFGLVLMCNRDDADPYTRMQQIIDIALEGELPEPELVTGARTRLAQVTIPAKVLDGLDGRYLDRASGEVIELKFNRANATIEGDKMGFALALRPSGPDTFKDPWPNFDTTMRIEALPTGRARLHVDFGGQTGTFERVDAYAPAADDLATAAGTYHAADLRSDAEAMVRSGRLVLRFGSDFHGESELTLEPLARDMFLARRETGGFKHHYAVRFRRDQGRVAGFLVSSDRLKDTRFDRA